MFSSSAVRGQRFQKIALIFLFSLLSVALIITWDTPATNYESSIYQSTPLILWVSVIASVNAGVVLVVVSIAKNELEQNSLWKIGFLLVFLCYTICLALFIIRGYYMWCMTGDPASHIGWIKETLDMGYTPAIVIYPITHVYLSEIVLMSDLDLIFLHKIIPLIFSLLCVLFVYIFARTLLSKPAEALLVAVISCGLAFGYYLDLTPNGLANLFIPFVLFLVVRYLQQKAWPWAVALSVVILLYPVFHPVPTVILGVMFLTLWILLRIPKVGKALHERKVSVLNFNRLDFKLLLPFLILLTWSIFWLSSFGTWDSTIRSIYQTICSEGETSQMTGLLDQVLYSQGYGYSVIEQVIKRLWSPIILSTLSVIALPLLWRNSPQERYGEYLFSFYGAFGVLALAIPALYLFNLDFGPLRFLFYVSILGAIFAAYLLTYLLAANKEDSESHASNLRKIFVILVIVGLFLGGVLNLYPSPYNLTQNYQSTKSEIVGMAYIYGHRDVEVPLSGITIAPGRFAHALLTPEERSLQRLPMYLEEQVAPRHFGYDEYSSIFSAYDEETDLVITRKDKTLYVDYFPDMAQFRYTNQDFERLTYDPSINSLYSNGDFDYRKITVMTHRRQAD
jgi:hypothetical protein